MITLGRLIREGAWSGEFIEGFRHGVAGRFETKPIFSENPENEVRWTQTTRV